jgi:septal ring factor EnvC (AmiA/AmiB activator)
MFPVTIKLWNNFKGALPWVCLLGFFFLIDIPGYGQNSRKALEAKRKKVEREILQSQQILKSTQNEKQVTLHQLNTLSQIIQQRQELISNLEMEVGAAENEIVDKKRHLLELYTDLEREKTQLHKTVVTAYKTRKSGQEVAFVFSANSFKQAFRRWKYLKKVSDYRRFQILQINEQQLKVAAAIEALSETRRIKTRLLINKEEERKKLEFDKQTKTQLVDILSKKEATLTEKIKQKEVQIAQLNLAIKNAIAKEIEAERRRKERITSREKKKTKPTGGIIRDAPEVTELSNSFKSNKGKLPWPVNQGFISQTFGVHAHPEFKNITLQNNGIDITTQAQQKVRAVFQGSVSAILSIPGEGEAVLINHGEYFSVYSRLSKVAVIKGQSIAIGDEIGTVMTDEEGKTILQFQLWEGQEKQNPQSWLKGR